MSPRRRPIHQRIARRLATRIEDAAPDAWQVDTGVDVLLDDDEVEPVEIAPGIVVYSAAHDVYAFAVYTYELDDATGGYIATGVHHDRLALAVPFDLDIELKAVRER
ncbi:hypothetical protein [Actinomadura nitritigenes]|uniref:hypothetical protein n=1 Tax=Actinomadura nitritigenes TaxID=134602 RepID=UPI003D935C47